MNKLIILLFGFVITFFGMGVASAFGTINSLGQHAEHEKITRMGLSEFGFGSKTLDEIAGKTGTFGAVGASDNPIRGLMSEAKVHCDGGDWLDVQGYPQSRQSAQAKINECRQWINIQFAQAVIEAGKIARPNGTVVAAEVPSIIPCIFNGNSGRAKCNTLEAMGLVLHTSQDFYAHSNWTDAPVSTATAETPPGLDQINIAPFMQIGQLDQPLPNGVISGCYEASLLSLGNESTTCNYAGNERRIKHEYLNKDTGMIDGDNPLNSTGETKRGAVGNNFGRAVFAAVADTKQKWWDFESAIRSRYPGKRADAILCALKGDHSGGLFSDPCDQK